MESNTSSKLLNSRSARMLGIDERAVTGQSAYKNGSIFTQSATSFTRGNIVWSFPKAKRFKDKEVTTKDVPMIDLGSTLSKSSTSLGFGKRLLFRPLETPGPEISHRELINTHLKFIHTSPSVPFNRESWDTHREIPGPGSYELPSAFSNSAKGVIIKSRQKPLDPVKENPGPDYYHPNNGSVQKTRFSAIAFGTSKRYDFTKLAQARNPGPGSYEILSNFEKKSRELKIRNELRIERARIENKLLSG
jgi:hypothetical protein